jgi:hypothetical protein
MAPKAKSRASTKTNVHANHCKHEELTIDPSTHALKAGYRHHTKAQIMTAASGRKKQTGAAGIEALLNAFPDLVEDEHSWGS